MTANLKRFVPAGNDGDPLVLSGTNLANVIVTASTDAYLTYRATAGFDRGNNIGIESFQGTTPEAQANALISTTGSSTAAGQVYVEFLAWPVAGTLTGVVPFFDLRGSANAIRAAVNPTGQLTCQNTSGGSPGGALGGTLHQMALNTRYRVELDCDPGTATVSPFDGFGALRLYDDEGAEIFGASISNGNFGTGQITLARVADSATTANGPTGMRMRWSLLAIDTAPTVPDIPGVAKNTPPASTTNYPRRLRNGVWV